MGKAKLKASGLQPSRREGESRRRGREWELRKEREEDEKGRERRSHLIGEE